MRFMTRLPIGLTAILLLVHSCQPAESPTLMPEGYDVVWDSQSMNSSESMPLGGGDVGLNVWVENNEVLMYISQSGTFDENNQMLKHGRVRVRLEPNPFEDAELFRQELVLEEGCIRISAANEKLNVDLLLWVDVSSPVVHVECKSSEPVELHAQYESWRTEDQELPPGTRHACFSYTSYPGEVVKYKDEIRVTEDAVQWMHRNREDKLLIDFCIDQQGLEEVRDRIHDTQRGRTFGGIMCGKGMVPDGREEGVYVSTPYKAWKLKSEKALRETELLIALETGQYEYLEEWNAVLKRTLEAAKSGKSARQETLDWWEQFWKRSWIQINADQGDPSDPAWQVGRNYQLFRYMLGCNAYGAYPSKFNGSLFTVDPVFVEGKGFDLDPDFRAWGGGSFTAQNQRLVYWPMLKTGDFDMMPSQFNYYRDALPSAEARTEVYWGHEGACFTEQLENFGLPFAGGWGFESGGRKREPGTEFGVQTNRYVNYHYVNQLEFSLMILDYHRFSGEDISGYLPFIKSSLSFFDKHYQYRQKSRSAQPLDQDGKLVIYPSTAAEMYKIALNPTDVIAALQTILPRMMELPDEYVSQEEKEYYHTYLERVPDIPFDEKEGNRVIKPAESWEYVANQEIPELYPVFPYGLYGKFKPDLETALNTWHFGESNEKREFIVCWSQVGIFAARLGLLEESKHLVTEKLKDSKRRFPAFWGPGPDWVPDVDHGGAGMINLQEMLMQTDGRKVYLFPTWPREWDVKFKLHAPFQTTIEGVWKDGKLLELKVLPIERRKDVQIVE